MKGIIWNDKTTELEVGIKNSIQAYEKRFGSKPKIVEVHRSKITEKKMIEGVEVRPVRYVQYNDYFAQEG